MAPGNMAWGRGVTVGARGARVSTGDHNDMVSTRGQIREAANDRLREPV